MPGSAARVLPARQVVGSLRAPRTVQWPVLAAISAGGAIGALGRFGLGQWFPAPARGFPWATFTANVVGCLLIGILMVLVNEVWPERRLVRPFLGVGVLGGFTTFSTYIVDIQRLTNRHASGVAMLYLAGTLIAAILAAAVGTGAARAAVGWRSRAARRG